MDGMSSASITNSSSDSGYFRLIFIPLCVLAIEVACFLSLQPLVGLIGSNQGVTSVIQVNSPADAVVTWVHNVIKSFVIGGLVWVVLFGRELYKARNENEAAAQDADSALPFPGLLWGLHLLSLLGLIFFRAKLNGYGGSEVLLASRADLIVGYATTFFAFALSGLRLWAPFEFWRSYLAIRRARVARRAKPRLMIWPRKFRLTRSA